MYCTYLNPPPPRLGCICTPSVQSLYLSIPSLHSGAIHAPCLPRFVMVASHRAKKPSEKKEKRLV